MNSRRSADRIAPDPYEPGFFNPAPTGSAERWDPLIIILIDNGIKYVIYGGFGSPDHGGSRMGMPDKIVRAIVVRSEALAVGPAMPRRDRKSVV